MLHFARRALIAARSLAPEDSGEYRRRMFADRAYSTAWSAAYYGSDSYKSWWVEFGSVNNRAHHVLVRAGRTAGMRIDQHARPSGARLP